MSKTIIITGATSGIGEAAVVLFLSKGWKVIATGRNVAKLEELTVLGAESYKLDVTNTSDINVFIDKLIADKTIVDVLVNNAGYGQFGTIEETEIIKARAQFETNVFGLAAITQKIVPIMRKNNSGRIINVSSIAGKTSMPGGGWYAASKFAVEAISDALRWETKQFGIKVSIIEPGPIKTDFSKNVDKNLDLNNNGPYGKLVHNLTQTATKSMKGGTVEGCAKTIYKAATSNRPRNRYLVTKEAKLIWILLHVMPPKLLDSVIRKMFIPK